MQWNRELAALIIVVLMITTVLLLVFKRKQLGATVYYFTIALSLSTGIEIIGFILRLYAKNFNTSFLYIVGTNFFVFLLFLIYFQSILQSKKYRTINLIIIFSFILNYFLSALLIDDFFNNFTFSTYFVEVFLLVTSIYLVLSQIFNSDKILVLSIYFPFWICISLLAIYLGVIPLIVISKTASKMMNLTIFYAILFIVNLIGYCILLLGIAKAKSEN